MRKVYIVTYDISSPKRLRKTFKLLKRYGDHLQLSVFICKLSERKRKQLEMVLISIIEPDEDQVLFFDISNENVFSNTEVFSIGKPFLYIERKPLII